ncbi:MAG TPA: L,D-transpeptidase [Xanthobacteraceae bacterium]|nr:L,D-transpeptidase [Xanthobacteraceae bacterium]
MKRLLAAAALLSAFVVSAAAQNRPQAAAVPAEPPSIVVTISVPKQEMRVVVDGIEKYVWPVSTGRDGVAITPAGTFKVQSMVPNAVSRLFNNAPMPWAIFYDGHYAIHGTTATHLLGRTASMGCTRLHPENAKKLFEMVKARGAQSLQVIVVRNDQRISSTSLTRR